MSGLIPSDGSVYSPEFTASAMIVYTTGEGMVVELTHLGRVWTQSRNPNGLIGWLTTVLPFTRA